MNTSRSVLDFSGDVGSAYSVVKIPDAPQHRVARCLTIEAWVNCRQETPWAVLLSKLGPNNLGFAFYRNEPTEVEFQGTREGQRPARVGPGSTPFRCNSWHHVAFVCDGPTWTFYLDGKQLNVFDMLDAPFTYEPSELQIGGKDARKGKTLGFVGQMAEVRLWNIRRSKPEVVANMHHRMRGTEAGLVGYWPFDEGAGSVVNDRSKNAAHGTALNAAWAMAELPLEEPLAPPEPSTQQKPEDTKPAENKPAESKPAENKPAESKPAENKTDQQAPVAGASQTSALEQALKECKACNDKGDELAKKLAEHDQKCAAYEQKLAELAKAESEHEKCHAALQKSVNELVERLSRLENELGIEQTQGEAKTAELEQRVEELEQRAKAPPPVVPVTPPKKPDNLSAVEGIGPKITELLGKAGIHTYADLAKAEVSHLKEILAAGGKAYQIADPASWPEQAKLAAEGRMDELKGLQDTLRAGRTS